MSTRAVGDRDMVPYGTSAAVPQQSNRKRLQRNSKETTANEELDFISESLKTGKYVYEKSIESAEYSIQLSVTGGKTGAKYTIKGTAKALNVTFNVIDQIADLSGSLGTAAISLAIKAFFITKLPYVPGDISAATAEGIAQVVVKPIQQGIHMVCAFSDGSTKASDKSADSLN